MTGRTLTILAALGLFAAAAPAAQAAPPAYAVTGKIAAGDGGWDYASVDAAHHRLYVARWAGVTAVDLATGAVTETLTTADRAHEPLVLPGGDELLVTSGRTNSVKIVEAKGGALIAELPAPKPDGAALDTVTGLVATSSGSGISTLIDPKTRTVVGQINVGGTIEFLVADGAGRVFANIENAGDIVVLDMKSKSLTARYHLDGCEEPGGLAFAADAGVFISACQNGVAKVISAASGKVVATLVIGKGPDAVIYDPARKLAFIPCGEDGVLEVVDPRQGADAAVVATIKTELGARTGAVDPMSGKLYLPTAAFGPAPAGGGKPPMVPGSFHILVVSPAG